MRCVSIDRRGALELDFMFFGVPLMNIPRGEIFGIAGPNCESTLFRFGFPAGMPRKDSQNRTRFWFGLFQTTSDFFANR